jgi:hypothetical protein
MKACTPTGRLLSLLEHLLNSLPHGVVHDSSDPISRIINMTPTQEILNGRFSHPVMLRVGRICIDPSSKFLRRFRSPGLRDYLPSKLGLFGRKRRPMCVDPVDRSRRLSLCGE